MKRPKETRFCVRTACVLLFCFPLFYSLLKENDDDDLANSMQRQYNKETKNCLQPVKDNNLDKEGLRALSEKEICRAHKKSAHNFRQLKTRIALKLNCKSFKKVY